MAPAPSLDSTMDIVLFCPKKQDDATGHLSLTLQASVVLEGKGRGLSWGSPSLKEGLTVKGRVGEVKDFGVFVQIDNSEVRVHTPLYLSFHLQYVRFILRVSILV